MLLTYSASGVSQEAIAPLSPLQRKIIFMGRIQGLYKIFIFCVILILIIYICPEKFHLLLKYLVPQFTSGKTIFLSIAN